jgi:hypothetical protein
MSGLRRAEHARKAYFYQLALASKRARAKNRKFGWRSLSVKMW